MRKKRQPLKLHNRAYVYLAHSILFRLFNLFFLCLNNFSSENHIVLVSIIWWQKKKWFLSDWLEHMHQNYGTFFLSLSLKTKMESNCRHISFNMHSYLGILEIWNHYMGEMAIVFEFCAIARRTIKSLNECNMCSPKMNNDL